MADAATELPIRTRDAAAPAVRPGDWRPRDYLQRAVDRLFDDFGRGFPRLRDRWLEVEPFAAGDLSYPTADMTESDGGFEIAVELPGIDEKNVDVTVQDGVITIAGQKREHHEEERRHYYLSERRFGSFRRSFRVPDSVDTDRIEAQFQKGLLKVTLPKTAAARQPEKKVPVKTG